MWPTKKGYGKKRGGPPLGGLNPDRTKAWRGGGRKNGGGGGTRGKKLTS